MTRLQLRGKTISDLLAQIRTEHGPNARIVAADRVRTGGIAGFFAKQHFEIAVEVPDSITAAEPAQLETLPQPRPPRIAATDAGAADEPLAALIAAAELDEGEASGQDETTSNDAFAAVLRQARERATGGPSWEDLEPASSSAAATTPGAPEPVSSDPVSSDSASSHATRPATAQPTEQAAPAHGNSAAPAGRHGGRLRPAPWLRALEPHSAPGQASLLQAAPPQPRSPHAAVREPLFTRARLSGLGVPDAVLDALPANPDPTELTRALAELPRLPSPRPPEGSVTVLVGEPTHVHVLATTWSHRWHIGDLRTGVHAAGDDDTSRRLAPSGRAASLTILPAQFTADDAVWAAQQLAAIDADRVLLVVDATRNMADIAHWMPGLNLDGLVLVNSTAASRPAAGLGLGLGLPMVELDSRASTPEEWAGLLTARCLGLLP